MYRDPLAGLLSQIATKRGLLATREQALSELLRAMLPVALMKTIERLRPKVDDEPDSLDALADVDAALDSLLAAHDEAAALLPKLRSCPDEVADPPRPHVRPPWVFEEPGQLEFRALFTKRLAEIAPDAYLVRWDDHTYLSRFELTRAPLLTAARCHVIPGVAVAHDTHGFARTSVPDGVPQILVHAESSLHRIGRVLHLVRDIKTGDEEFDHAFVVDAPPGTIALFGADVRAALVGLSSQSPRLAISHGVAEITWKGDWSPQQLIPDGIISVLLGIRAAIERA